MSGDKVWTAAIYNNNAAVDAVSGATPLAIATLTEAPERIEQVLVDSGYSFSQMFWGLYPGSIGSTSTFLCLVGAFILIILGIASYRIILGGVLGVLMTGWLLNLLAGGSSLAWLTLNPFYHLVMGGVAFGLAYMATDPVSAPDMENAKWIYGFLIGVLTVLIRVFNPAFPEGIMLAILFMNLFAPLLDYFAVKTVCKKRIPNV
jgi:Na+-transporting NADH:ubiquinone oxidoreductase subunit B